VPFKRALGQTPRSMVSADKARWIAWQMERTFGLQGTYLIDFYHLFEYLGQHWSGLHRIAKKPGLTTRKKD
jgi:hypothetical protein